MKDTKIFDSFVLGLLLIVSHFLFAGFVVRKGLILCVSVYQMISVIIRTCVFAKRCKTWYRPVCGNDCCEGPVVDLLDYLIQLYKTTVSIAFMLILYVYEKPVMVQKVQVLF